MDNRCPTCGSEPSRVVLLLERRTEDQARVCRQVIGCPNGHGPWWRWNDREDDALVEDAGLARYVEGGP